MNLVLQIGALAVALAAIGVLIRTAWRTWRAVWRVWKKAEAFFDDWNGEPARPGRPARPSMPERMTAVETASARVASRLTQVESAVHNI